MTDVETPPVDCPDCGEQVRDDVPPVDVLLTCDACGHRFWVRPVDPFDDPGDEIPPGMLAIACLNGGGTATVCGNLRENTAITTAQQAQAVQRMTQSSISIGNVQADVDDVQELRRRNREQQFAAHVDAMRNGGQR